MTELIKTYGHYVNTRVLLKTHVAQFEHEWISVQIDTIKPWRRYAYPCVESDKARTFEKSLTAQERARLMYIANANYTNIERILNRFDDDPCALLQIAEAIPGFDIDIMDQPCYLNVMGDLIVARALRPKPIRVTRTHYCESK